MHNSPSSWMLHRTKTTITLQGHYCICIIIQKEQAVNIIQTRPQWMGRPTTTTWMQQQRIKRTTMNKSSVKETAITAGINLVFYNNLVRHTQSYHILRITTTTTIFTVTMQVIITWICPTVSAWVAQEWVTTTIMLDRREMQVAITEKVPMEYLKTPLQPTPLHLSLFHWVINLLIYQILRSLPC